jgi:hypothetical protein
MPPSGATFVLLLHDDLPISPIAPIAPCQRSQAGGSTTAALAGLAAFAIVAIGLTVVLTRGDGVGEVSAPVEFGALPIPNAAESGASFDERALRQSRTVRDGSPKSTNESGSRFEEHAAETSDTLAGSHPAETRDSATDVRTAVARDESRNDRRLRDEFDARGPNARPDSAAAPTSPRANYGNNAYPPSANPPAAGAGADTDTAAAAGSGAASQSTKAPLKKTRQQNIDAALRLQNLRRHSLGLAPVTAPGN